MRVADVVGRALAELGADHVFGVVGSGNFHVTNVVVVGGVRFVVVRHECGVATMADAYVRISGRFGVLSVYQGCGLINAMTGIVEVVKSRMPLVVLAVEVTSPRSNFFVDQAALAESVGAVSMRVTAVTAIEDVLWAVRTVVHDWRTVLFNLPLDVQAADTIPTPVTLPAPDLRAPDPVGVAALVAAIGVARWLVFIAGWGV